MKNSEVTLSDRKQLPTRGRVEIPPTGKKFNFYGGRLTTGKDRNLNRSLAALGQGTVSEATAVGIVAYGKAPEGQEVAG